MKHFTPPEPERFEPLPRRKIPRRGDKELYIVLAVTFACFLIAVLSS